MQTLFLLLALAADPAPADIVIKNATIHDGTGKAGYVGDVAIAGDKIVGVGKVAVDGKTRVIDGTGLIIAPGFIDLHTHCDSSITEPGHRLNKCYLMQGVTTVITGNCGSGPANVKAFYDKLDKNGVGTNVAHLVPHNSVRSQAMGNANRQPTDDELHKMEALVDAGMKDGAWGLATGLIYTPGTYAKTDEIIALAKVASKHHGIYASHMRHEDTRLLEAIEETLTIGREAKLPVHISHIKASGKKAWGLSADAVGLIQKARTAGMAVTADQYPYIASSTSLAATVVPTRYRDGTGEEYRKRFDDAEKGPQMRKAIEADVKGREKSIVIASYSKNRKWQGKSLGEIAEMEKKSATDIAIEIEKAGGASVVNFGMSEEDVRIYMKQPWVATASDGSAQIPGDTVPHPRSYGTFPLKIGRYSIVDGVIPIEQAIRSSSGLPADIIGFKGRGYLKPGQFADVVVFDPKTFRDTATYDKPHQYATGVKYLFVNGKTVIDGGEFKDVLAGKALRHKSD
ncbi:MAG TPA: D-aminoacylase [Gemmataceae bacterium]|jgi:N-acyl-D-aspartate/D-glutamate deacylase|nr:D-aminoacylase [Gemmataceae bacterium]